MNYFMNSRLSYSTMSACIFSPVVPAETAENFVKLKEWISYAGSEPAATDSCKTFTRFADGGAMCDFSAA